MRKSAECEQMQKLENDYNELAEDYFQLTELVGIGMTFIVLGIALTYGLVVQSDVRGDINQTSDPEAYQAATDSINAVGELSSSQGLIITVVVAAVILGILVVYLWKRFA